MLPCQKALYVRQDQTQQAAQHDQHRRGSKGPTPTFISCSCLRFLPPVLAFSTWISQKKKNERQMAAQQETAKFFRTDVDVSSGKESLYACSLGSYRHKYQQFFLLHRYWRDADHLESVYTGMSGQYQYKLETKTTLGFLSTLVIPY